jgi:penicillin-binding protein activator
MEDKVRLSRGLAVLCFCSLVGCISGRSSYERAGVGYNNPDEAGMVTGVGIESQDIRGMTDRMARDILSAPQVAGLPQAPYVIVDDEYFQNQSSSPINKRMITERLMIELNRAAQGRMFFVERQAEGMVAQERNRKRNGELGAGSLQPTRQIAGADYRLTGTIMDQSAVVRGGGAQTRYHQITFKLVDLESGLTIWSNLYEFQKSATTDVLYN